MLRLVRPVLFHRWLNVQGGEVSLLPIFLLLAVALGFSYVGAPKTDILPLPESVRFEPCEGVSRINCVVDGDTIWANGEKIRLTDIDAPEVFSPRCEWERIMGKRATERLASLLNDGHVALKTTTPRNRDKYGRLLRVATVNGRSVGDRLVSEGLAYRWGVENRGWCT